MKMFKKSLSIILAVIMLLGCTSVMAFASEDDVTVSLRIEGITECLYYGDVTVANGSTALDVLKVADESDDSLSVVAVDSEYGAYIVSINGITAGTYTTMMWDGWSFMVDDETLNKKYSQIPESVDILLSHDSPNINKVGAVLDENSRFYNPFAGNSYLFPVH